MTQDSVKRNFILQQGFEGPVPAVCRRQYSALHFQPRIVFVCIAAGIALQSQTLFYILCAALWWSAVLPKFNPFDALYNATLGGRAGAVPLNPAPSPRRTAQAMAGAFALACALLIHFGFRTAAYSVEGVFIAAVTALIFGSFCLGSFVYHLLVGKGSFACQTLPWAG